MNNWIKILLTGDLALMGGAESLPERKYTLKISSELFSLFNSYDIKIANLETPLTTTSSGIIKTGPHLRVHPASITIVKDLGINVACLANNHIRDFGDKGVYDTINTCKQNNIMTVGAGSDLETASEVLFISFGNKKIAILNFSETEYNIADESSAGGNPDDPIHIWRSIQSAKKVADYLIVVMHGGKELYPYPTPYQLTLYRFIADLGVSAVIGHHSHVIGGYEIYNGIPIVYSLGNFIFDEEGNCPDWYHGALIGLVLNEKKVIDVTFYHTTFEHQFLILKGQQNIKNVIKNVFMKEINEVQVNEMWKDLVKNKKETIIKNILNYNLLRCFMYKLGIKFITKNEVKRLLSTWHRMTCTTRRLLNKNALDCFFKNGNLK